MDDTEVEGIEDVVVTLFGGTDYTLGAPGTETATVGIEDNEENPNDFRLSNTAIESVHTLQGSEGDELTSVLLMTFSDADLLRTADEYTATIDWGDGSAHETVAVGGGVLGMFSVTGTHTYEKPGLYTVGVTVTAISGAPGSAQAHLTARITQDDRVSGQGESVGGVQEGVELAATHVASFTLTGEPSWAASSSYYAYIDWGDGSAQTAATVEKVGNELRVHSLPHTFHHAGTFRARVRMGAAWDDVGEVDFATADVTVGAASPGVLGLTGMPVTAGERAEVGPVAVARFTPESGKGVADYTAKILWGDGTPEEDADPVMVGTEIEVRAKPVNGATHRFGDIGGYRARAEVTPAGSGAAESIHTTALVSEVALSVATADDLRLPVSQEAESIRLLKLTNPVGGELGGDYAARIDWGDGVWSHGVVHGSSGDGLWVSGTHAYTVTGELTAVVTLREGGEAPQTFEVPIEVVRIDEMTTYPAETTAYAKIELAFPLPTPNSMDADIDWSDGTTPDHLTLNPNDFENWGPIDAPAHTYQLGSELQESYAQVLDVDLEVGEDSYGGTATRKIRISDTLLGDQGGITIAADAGTSTGTTLVHAFTDPFARTGEVHSAVIDWGDGTSETVGAADLIVSSGTVEVWGSHTYAEEGSYEITVVLVTGAFAPALSGFNASRIGTSWADVQPAQPGNVEAGQRRNELSEATWLGAGLVDVSASTGSLRLAHGLDFDLSPGTEVGGTPALVYVSDTVRPRPVIEATVSPDYDLTAETTIDVTLTWDNGTAQSTVSHNFSSPDQSTYIVSAQVDVPVAASGVYDWTLDVTYWEDVGGVSTRRDAQDSGLAQVVVRDNSDFGSGWWLEDQHQLVIGDEGVLLIYGSGESRFFEEVHGQFVSPAEDFGSLTQAGSGYEYRSKHGIVWNFDNQVWSGKGVTLPSLPPLRTGRASFPASGSSLYERPSRDAALFTTKRSLWT